MALTRGVILALGFVGVATFVDFRSREVEGAAALSLETVWHKWDARWYERIAREGYAYEPGDVQGQAKTAYFPLYPLTVGLLLGVLPSVGFFWLGSLVSTACTFAAGLLIVRHLVPNPASVHRVLGLLLSAAGSFYFSVPYTEGLFLLLVVGTVVLTRHRKYAWAGVLAGLAAITRVHGFALIAVPFVAAWIERPQPAATRLRSMLLAALLFAVPVSAYLLFLWQGHGSAGAFVDRQAAWSNAFPYPFRALVGLVEYPRRVQAYLHGGMWFLYLVLTLRYVRRMSAGELVFCLSALLISTLQDSFQGVYRYVAVLVPVVLALADDHPTVRASVITINIIFGTVMILAFVTWNRLAV
jgi:hypothetical protein